MPAKPQNVKRRKRRKGQIKPTLARRFWATVWDNKGKVGAGIVTVILAGSGWYVTNCLNDKKAHIREFREIINERRVADEKLFQDLIILERVISQLVDYLDQATITISEIKKREDHIASLAATANSDCNSAKQLFYKYRTSQDSIHRDHLMPLPDWPDHDFSDQCEGFARLGAGLHRPEPQRLVSDREYREGYIVRQRIGLNDLRQQFETYKQLVSAEKVEQDKLIETVDMRDSSLIKGVWDCLKLQIL